MKPNEFDTLTVFEKTVIVLLEKILHELTKLDETV